MAIFEYHRPKTMAEAISLLARGNPLGGGTSLTPQRTDLKGVVDLQALSLDRLEFSAREISAGATLSLEALAQACQVEAPAVSEAARKEASLNLRNVATLAGAIVAGGGRSPLAAVLLAARAFVTLEPGAESAPLDVFLNRRDAFLTGRVVVTVHIPRPVFLGYLQVGRSPADRPIVCAALARWTAAPEFSAALGGYGSRPTFLDELPPEPGAAGVVAREAYSGAGDAWASAEYRAEVAAVLVGRLLREADRR